MKFGFFECKFCNQRYVKEAAFKKHSCDLMERDTYVRTKMRGRFAFNVYLTWLKVRGYQPQGRDVFIESRYYTSILKFVEFYFETMLPDMEDYVKFVVKGDFLPQMWTNTTVYEQYITSFDQRIKPLKQAEITFKYLDVLARQLECESPAEIFDYIYVNELVKLIQCRRFTPWVLLVSKRFLRYMAELDDAERAVLEAMVNEDIWLKKVRENPKDYKTISQLTKELGI